jgi:hypothetical protein
MIEVEIIAVEAHGESWPCSSNMTSNPLGVASGVAEEWVAHLA